jgi:methylthioribose-1-phosphate isomerase
LRIDGKHHRSIWLDPATAELRCIDQTHLPHHVDIRKLADLESALEAIRNMRVRGAPLIGATAAHAIALVLARDPSDAALENAARELLATRPTAVNLRWAINRMLDAVERLEPSLRADRALAEAVAICDEDVEICESIGNHGLVVLKSLAKEKANPAEPLQVLTHCNAGWLATVDWGTALAPIYKAHEAGVNVHVWVDETRPRNQGSSLTAFELREQGVPHTVIVDNAGGHLMQQGRVDCVIVGSDRTTARGDVCNKIGTYLKALAAVDNGVPFYVALPMSTIDWEIRDGINEIPIEERSVEEVRKFRGLASDGEIAEVEIFDDRSPVANPAFDVTPARLVTGLVTEYGFCEASEVGLSDLRKRSGDYPIER